MKIDESITAFINYIAVERRLSALTVESYSAVLSDFSTYLASCDINEVEQLDALAIREWQMQLMEQGNQPRTVKQRLSALRSWHRYLRKMQWIDKDPFLKISAPKADKKLPIFYKESEVEQLYRADLFSDDYIGWRDKIMLRMLYETGMRRAELVGLTESSIDFSGQTVKVLGKRNKERFIPLQQEMLQSIRQYLDIKHKEENGEQAALFLTSGGKPINNETIAAVVKQYMGPISQADRISPHIFRHTFATEMLNEGANIDAVKELLGHASLDATEIYTHVTREHLKEAYKHAHPRSGKNRKDPDE